MKSFLDKFRKLLRMLVGTAFAVATLFFLASHFHNLTSRDEDPRIIHLTANSSASVINSFTGKNVSIEKHGDTTDVFDGNECIESDNCEVVMPQSASLPKKKKVAIFIQDH